MPSTWGPEEWIAAASVANAVLVLVLVFATIFYAIQTLRTVSELREARIIETIPVLHWQRHPGSVGAGYQAGAGFLTLNLNMLLTNYGRGAARLLTLSATMDTGEAFAAPAISLPSTLPAGERIELRLRQERAAQDYPGQRTVTITLRYADAHGVRTYETRAQITATWPAQGNSGIVAFDDSDERTPEQRRVRA
jgi:hypothetical protein